MLTENKLDSNISNRIKDMNKNIFVWIIVFKKQIYHNNTK